MPSETKNCQNCRQSFLIEPEDFDFYEKIKVPAPTWCPECRQLRRYAWRNERILYRRNCDLCGKSTVSIYSSNKPYKVYCVPCWWSDKWDASAYARDFDFSRPFFEQWHELHLAVPRITLLSKNSVNSDYTNHSNDNKNCYFTFTTFNSENIMYSNRVLLSKDCSDCLNLIGHGLSELCYECINCEKCYKCIFGYLLKECHDCAFCFDCRNCSDCVLSWNLRNKQYHINNIQYSKEEYGKKLKELGFEKYKNFEKARIAWQEIIKNKAVHRPAIMEKTVDCTGNFITYSKNTKQAFFIDLAENSKYVISGGLGIKDSMDCYNFGAKSELAYECHAVIGGYMMLFSHLSYDNSFITYCDSCHNSNNLFGCVGVKKKEYQIFNKQYSEKEYGNLKNRIIEHMKKAGEYGQFFPPQLSPFGYNETQGFIHEPMSKEEALKQGFKWEEQTTGIYNKTTLTVDKIPQSIKETSNEITKEVLECVNCGKNYNIVTMEIEIYRKMNIPIPRECYDCRYLRRIKTRPSRHLWTERCQCKLNDHDHENRCLNEFQTAYPPHHQEKVWCENCYQNEIV